MQAENTEISWWREPTRAQWSAFIAAWSGWVLDAFDFTIFFLAAPYIAAEFGVSITAVMGSLTLTLLVRLLGGMVAGAAADRWGRKLPLMISIVWFALCDGAIYFAPSFTWILVLRAVFGLGMGAEWTAGTTLAMENWPERSRGIASGILQGSWAIGFLLASLVSGIVISAWGWRPLFLIAALPALIVFPIRFWVTESDEWKENRAKAAKKSFRELLTPEIVRSLMWGTLAMGLGFGVYYSMVSPYAMMLHREHDMAAVGIGNLSAIFNIGMLCGAIVIGWVAKKYGVRWAVTAPAFLMVPLLPLYVGGVDGGLTAGAFLGGLVGVGFTGVVPLLLTSLFPAAIRGRCVGFVYHAGAFLAAFVPPGVPALASAAGISLGAAIGLASGTFLVLLGLLMLKPFDIPEESALAAEGI